MGVSLAEPRRDTIFVVDDELEVLPLVGDTLHVGRLPPQEPTAGRPRSRPHSEQIRARGRGKVPDSDTCHPRSRCHGTACGTGALEAAGEARSHPIPGHPSRVDPEEQRHAGPPAGLRLR